VTSGQEDPSSRFADPNDVARGRSRENAILTDKQLLDSIRSPNLRNQLCNLGIPVTTVASDDEEGAFCSLGDGKQDAGYEGLAVVLLLEDFDLLSKPGTGTKPRVSHEICRGSMGGRR